MSFYEMCAVVCNFGCKFPGITQYVQQVSAPNSLYICPVKNIRNRMRNDSSINKPFGNYIYSLYIYFRNIFQLLELILLGKSWFGIIAQSGGTQVTEI